MANVITPIRPTIAGVRLILFLSPLRTDQMTTNAADRCKKAEVRAARARTENSDHPADYDNPAKDPFRQAVSV